MREIPLSRGFVALVSDESYDLISQFKWTAMVSPRLSGLVYAFRQADGVTYLMHRVVLGLRPDRVPEVDHIDGNGLNNRMENLRLATRAQNAYNMRPRVGETSRYKGVYWDKATNKWRAQVKVDGKAHALGRFLHEEDAARAYDDAARQFFGDFARFNIDIM